MTTLCIGIRIHAENNRPLQDYYVDNMLYWLQYRNYDIEYYTSGIHLDTENPHLHLHVIATGKKLSNPVATLKRDYDTKKIVTQFPAHQEYDYPESVVGQKYKGKINLSIRMTDPQYHPSVLADDRTSYDKNIRRYLGYPLKEKRPLRNTYPDWETLMEEAHAEYKQAIARHEATAVQKERKEQKQLSEWVKLSQNLEENNPQNLEEAFRFALTYYKENYEKPPTGKMILDNAERYCIKHGVLTYEDLVAKYIGRW